MSRRLSMTKRATNDPPPRSLWANARDRACVRRYRAVDRVASAGATVSAYLDTCRQCGRSFTNHHELPLRYCSVGCEARALFGYEDAQPRDGIEVPEDKPET